LDFSGQLSLSYFMHWGFPYNGFNACIGVKKRVWVLHGASGSALRFWVWFTSLFSSFFATTPLPSSSPVNNFDLKVHIMFLGFYFISMLFSGYWGVGLVYGRRVKMILSTSIRESSVCFCAAANFFFGGGRDIWQYYHGGRGRVQREGDIRIDYHTACCEMGLLDG